MSLDVPLQRPNPIHVAKQHERSIVQALIDEWSTLNLQPTDFTLFADESDWAGDAMLFIVMHKTRGFFAVAAKYDEQKDTLDDFTAGPITPKHPALY